MAIRLYVEEDLAEGICFQPSENHFHYLFHVMRQQKGDQFFVFNGRQGEWITVIEEVSKKTALVRVLKQTRAQDEEKLPDVWLCFAPIKKDKQDWLIEKATELGVSKLVPVITRRTIVSHFHSEKLFLRAIEAAEQCERLSVPFIEAPVSLDVFLSSFPKERTLFYLNERGEGADLTGPERPVAFLVGPEGGFETTEIQKLGSFSQAISLHLGRLILRAETAGIAILAAWNQCLGWHDK